MHNNSDYVETPLGIFTTSGNWFYTNSEQINSFAPGLLEKTPLEKIINDAESWVKSTDSLSLLLFVILLQFIYPAVAVVISLLFLFSWHLTKSAFIGSFSTTIVKILNYDAIVLIASVASISYLGIIGNYEGVGLGLLFFLVFRFGWMRKLFDTFYNNRNKGITLNDRVAKMVILRHAMREQVLVSQVNKMEAEILELMRRKRNPKSRNVKETKSVKKAP